LKTKQVVTKNSGQAVFFTDLKSELNKVEWPLRSFVLKSSMLVLFIMFFFAAFVAVTDGFFSRAVVSLKGI